MKPQEAAVPGVARVAQRLHRHRAAEFDQRIVCEFETCPLRRFDADRLTCCFEQTYLSRRDLDDLEDIRRQRVAIACPCSCLDNEVGKLEALGKGARLARKNFG